MSSTQLIRLVAVLGLVIGVSAVDAQTIIHVDDDTPAGGNGATWATAFDDLQLALNEAESGDEIRVAGGVYVPSVRSEPETSRTETFQLINGVSLSGGYAGLADRDDPDYRDIEIYESILSGDLNGDDVDNLSDFFACLFERISTHPECEPLDEDGDGWVRMDDAHLDDNSYHVVTGSGTDDRAVLAGFTVTAGDPDAPYPSPHRFGGGMYNLDASPTLTSCTFRHNVIDGNGGGMYNENAAPTLINCTFYENFARAGGGMFNDRSHPTLTDCVFSENASGGMHNSHSNPTLVNCMFSGNSSGSGGGMENCNSNPTLEHSLFLCIGLCR